VAEEEAAAWLLVGHTADDQAETVLLRAARGTGLDGLAAMAPRSGRVLRPLLGLRRGDVRAFVTGEGLPSAHDPSNDDTRFARVGVRRHVLPALADLAPDPVGALTRLAALARDDRQALDAAAAEALRPVQVGDARVLEARVLEGLPVALARRVVRAAVADLAGRGPSAGSVERALGLATGLRASLPGALQAERTRHWLVVARDDVPVGDTVDLDDAVHPWPPAGRWLHRFVPSDRVDDAGQPSLPLAGAWTPPAVRTATSALTPDPRSLTLWLPRLDGRLTVRVARDGDRVAGGAGRRRLVEAFRAAGFPRAVRRRWPVVALDDEVVWVPGVAVDTGLARAGGREPRAALVLTDGPRPPTAVRRRRPRGGG
jgi:tRNA(Ile)-lysidine synthase